MKHCFQYIHQHSDTGALFRSNDETLGTAAAPDGPEAPEGHVFLLVWSPWLCCGQSVCFTVWIQRCGDPELYDAVSSCRVKISAADLRSATGTPETLPLLSLPDSQPLL